MKRHFNIQNCIFWALLLMVFSPIIQKIGSEFKQIGDSGKWDWNVSMLMFTILSSGYFYIKACYLKTKTQDITAHCYVDQDQLYPEYFMDYILKGEDGCIDQKLILQRECITTKFKILSKERESYPTAQKISELKEEYKACILNYFNYISDNNNIKRELENIQNRIDLLRNIIRKERESYLVYCGDQIVTFNFNRQNHATDLFLTGVAIPLLLDIMEKQPANIEEMLIILFVRNVNRIFACAFIIVLAYRIMKYIRNKNSMLESKTINATYVKADLILDTFENAFIEAKFLIECPITESSK